MFARVTPYKMKASTRDEATALLHSLRAEIMGLDGMKEFLNVSNGDGAGYVVSLVESEEASDANAEKVNAIWAKFADHLEAIPQPEGYDVIAHWQS